MSPNDFYLWKLKKSDYLAYHVTKNIIPSPFSIASTFRDFVWYYLYHGSSLNSSTSLFYKENVEPLLNLVGEDFLRHIVKVERECELELSAMKILKEDGIEYMEEDTPCFDIYFGKTDDKCTQLSKQFFSNDGNLTKKVFGNILVFKEDEIVKKIYSPLKSKKHKDLGEIISEEVMDNIQKYSFVENEAPFLFDYVSLLMINLCDEYNEFIPEKNQKLLRKYGLNI